MRILKLVFLGALIGGGIAASRKIYRLNPDWKDTYYQAMSGCADDFLEFIARPK